MAAEGAVSYRRGKGGVDSLGEGGDDSVGGCDDSGRGGCVGVDGVD